MTERVLLIGMMGSGKTTVGRLLAGRLGFAYLDSDEEIFKRCGRSVREIFESDGEPAFRRAEAAVLEEALAGDENAVVSVAGGAVLDESNRARLAAAGTVVWLRAPIDLLTERVGRQTHRPLLDGGAEAALERLYAEREPLYAALAGVVVDVEGLTPDEIVDVITEALA